MHFTALPAGVLAIQSMGQMQYKKLQPEVEMSMATRAKVGCFHVYRSFAFFLLWIYARNLVIYLY